MLYLDHFWLACSVAQILSLVDIIRRTISSNLSQYFHLAHHSYLPLFISS